MTRLCLLIIAACAVLVGGLFAWRPDIDLRIAVFFNDPATQAALTPYRGLIEGVRDGAPWIITALAVAAVATLVAKIAWPARPMLMRPRSAFFMIVTLALGPGLLVNGLLKPHWPRPRPGAVTELGGPLPFMPWWDPRGSCDGNCSFVSGEVAGAMWTLAPAVLVPTPWRAAAITAAFTFTITIAAVRIIQGGHFASDAAFAAIFTTLLIWLAHTLIFRWPGRPAWDALMERRLARVSATMPRSGRGSLPTGGD